MAAMLGFRVAAEMGMGVGGRGWFKEGGPEISGSGLGKESCGDLGRTPRAGRLRERIAEGTELTVGSLGQ